jgi:5-methylcytosine-specific restriction endonuclease McrA
MGDYIGSMFPKTGRKKISALEKDKRQKKLFAAVWAFALFQKYGILPPKEDAASCMDAPIDVSKGQYTFCCLAEMELDHLENRSTDPAKKYDLDNLQLISRYSNRRKKEIGLKTDFRPTWFKKEVKKYAY